MTTTIIESSGVTALVQVDNNLYLNPVAGGTGPVLKYQGSPVTLSGGTWSGWVPMGAEQTTGGGYQIVWKNPANGLYQIMTFDSGGNFVSQVVNLTGSSTTLKLAEQTFYQDLNGDGMIGFPAIESSGVTALVQAGNNYYLNPVAGGAGVLLKANGAPVDTTQFSGWAAIGAELKADASGYEVVLKRGADEYCIWNVDISGNYISQVLPLTGSSTQILSAESDLHQDLNGDGWTGTPPTITIESSGLTKLDQLGNYYYLDTGAGGSGPTLKFNGAVVLASQYTPTWTLLGAEQISGGYEVVWKLTGSDQYRIWTTDINGNCVTANNAGAFAGLSAQVEAAEIVLQQDLNGDGAIGVPTITIESFGVTKLDQVGNNYYLDPVAGGAGVLLKANGAPVDTTQFYGWAAIGAERTADGYEVVLKRGADEYCIWNVDSAGNYISQVLPLTGSSAAIEAAEVILKQDLNGNGAIGVPSPPVVTITSPAEASNNPYQTITGTVVSGGTAVVAGQTVTLTDNGVTLGTAIVQADGSFSTNVTLPYQGANAIVATVADSYGNVGVSAPVVDTLNGAAVVMKYDGTPVTPALDPGWVALGAEPTANGYEVVWKNSNFGVPVYALYYLDSTGNYIGGVSNPTNATVASWESSFHQDLNGDGMIGLPVVEPSGGAATIESFGTTALVQVGSNYYLGAGGSGPELKYNGTPVTTNPFGGWVAIGAEQTSSGYQVALKVLGEDKYCVWNVDGNGNYLSNSTGTVSNWYLDGSGHYNSNITDPLSGSSVALETAELTFHQDLNSDGTIGIPSGSGSPSTTIIESSGATTLVQQGSNYYLYTASPTVTITSPAVASNNPNQTITGMVVSGGTAVVAGQTVTLTDNGKILGTAVVRADGSFSAEVILPYEGANSIVASVTDSYGIPGHSAPVVDTLDDIPPTVTITSPAEASSNPNQTIAGTVVSGGAAVVAGQTVTLTDNGVTLGTAIVQADGSFSTNVTLPYQGANAIVATVADSYGNVGVSAPVVDTLNGAAVVMKYDGTPVTPALDPGWVPLGAEPTASGYQVVLKNSNFGVPVYALYYLDSSGNYVGGVSNPTNATVASWESSFHQDLNGDGMIGLPVVEPSSGAATIESFGTTALVQVGSNYYLGAGGSGPELKYNGTPATTNPFGGWVVIGAEQTSSGYQVALKVLGEDKYCVWNVDGNGNYLSNSTGTVSSWYLDGSGHYNSNITDALSGSSAALETAELTFHQDLNSDGTIGIPSGSGSPTTTIIESSGATTLVQQGSDYYLYTASPTVTITSPAVASNNPNQTITGTVVSGGSAVAVGQTVTLTDNGKILGTAVVQADGSFSAGVTLPSQGANAIVAVVTSGGVTGVSAAVVDTLDDIAPGLTIIAAPVPGNASAQAVSGRVALGGAAAVVGQTVTLTDNGAVLATTSVKPDGSFSTNVTLPNQSSNAIMVSVADSYGNTNNTYLATTGSGQIAITAHNATGTTNELDFTGGITDQNLWFLKSGNDLQIDILGTNTHVTVGGWFSSSDNQLQDINAGGLKIDNGVSQLVQAMATYSANNSGFDPTSTAVHMVPNDAGLQSALAATWHS